MLRVVLHQGLGDTLYARPHVMELCSMERVAVETPFPQFFDSRVSAFIKPTTNLLPTQRKSVSRWKDWSSPACSRSITMIYPRGMKEGLSIPEALDRFAKPKVYDFSLAIPQIWVEEAKEILDILDPPKPVCLVKFPTERTHFNLPARNPKLCYFERFMESNDFSYIDITETDQFEWYAETPPDLQKLDLPLETLIGMMKLSAMNLFPPGFMLPLSIALNVPATCIFGGYVKPELLLDPRMDLTKLTVIAPEPFCNCQKATHDCNKEIDERRFLRSRVAA